MKILTFADLHGDFQTLAKLVKRAKKDDIELVVCAGDISVFERDITNILRQLEEINKTILMIPGNHESPEVLNKEFRGFSNFVNLHNKVWEKEDIHFMGWGTDGFQKHSEELRELAKRWSGIKGKKVIVTHSPPHKTKLDFLHNSHIGNIDLRKAIERLKPKLSISGHIHENEGKHDMIGDTLVVNPGWNGMILDI